MFNSGRFIEILTFVLDCRKSVIPGTDPGMHPPPLKKRKERKEKKKDWRDWTYNLYNNVYVFWLYVHNIVTVWSFFAIFLIS
jgi:hypothetical protein